MEAIVTDIQRFSLDDGPGIRTTVFFKGCPLACKWCHNPECISPQPQLRFSRPLCAGCGLCASTCENGVFAKGQSLSFKKCVACGACVKKCVTRALSLVGGVYSPEALVAELMDDSAFYQNSGGGVTLSGGEPLLHAPFAVKLTRLLRENNVHVAVDTCGNVPFSSFEALLPAVGLFLFDLKAYSPGLHKALTGKSNARILENFKRLQRSGARIWVRLPLVSGENDDISELRQLARLLGQYPVERVELLPYHQYGVSKYPALGMAYAGVDFSAPDASRLSLLASLFAGEVHIKQQ